MTATAPTACNHHHSLTSCPGICCMQAASFPHSGNVAYILPKPKMGEKFSKKYDIIVIIGNKVYSIRMQRIKTDGRGKRIACAMLACDTVVKALHGPDSMCSFPGRQKDEVSKGGALFIPGSQRGRGGKVHLLHEPTTST